MADQNFGEKFAPLRREANLSRPQIRGAHLTGDQAITHEAINQNRDAGRLNKEALPKIVEAQTEYAFVLGPPERAENSPLRAANLVTREIGLHQIPHEPLNANERSKHGF